MTMRSAQKDWRVDFYISVSAAVKSQCDLFAFYLALYDWPFKMWGLGGIDNDVIAV